MSARLVVVGDAVLDVDVLGHAERLCPDAPVPVLDETERCPRPGGAGLAAALAAADGHDVCLITALGRDRSGARLKALLKDAGVTVCDVGLRGPTATKVRLQADGRPLVRLDSGGKGPYPVGRPDGAAADALSAADAVLVSDYGRGMASSPLVRQALAALPSRIPVVWDPHPRGSAPIPGVRLATPNCAEAAAFAGGSPDPTISAVTANALALVGAWTAAGVAVTIGNRGALLAGGDGVPLVVPAPVSAAGDACGAGDRFAAAAAAFLARGALPSEAVAQAVSVASAFVASGGVAGIERSAVSPSPAEWSAETLSAAVRARGGTVVATGGCFDLLHAGHVAVLSAARRLGDCLIVCLNSDSSVRRLKGAGRPVVSQDDRAAVLLSLEAVDAVVVFDEDTPAAALKRIRPHVFAKGADYAEQTLPETEVLAEWGGQAVILPYVPGRSTSRLIQEVTRSA